MIQNVFVLLLLSVFAILSTFLVTVGAQLYRNTVDSAEKNNNTRIMTAVVRSAIWAEDGGQVETETLQYDVEDGPSGELTALSILHEYDGEIFVKRLYAYEGWLRESFTEKEMPFNPEYGEELCEIAGFEPAINGKQLTVELETKDHQQSTVKMVLRAGGAEQ
jgi:hypothetical protein